MSAAKRYLIPAGGAGNPDKLCFHRNGIKARSEIPQGIATKGDRDMRGLLIATLSLGLLLVAGCAERRYSTYDPYYGNGSYRWNSYEDACYRQWLSECHYNYVAYNRLG